MYCNECSTNPPTDDFRIPTTFLRRSPRLSGRLRTTTRIIAAADEDDAAGRQKLKELIGRHFEVRQSKLEHKLARLERQIEELRRNLVERRRYAEQLKTNRFDDLIGPTGDNW